MLSLDPFVIETPYSNHHRRRRPIVVLRTTAIPAPLLEKTAPAMTPTAARVGATPAKNVSVKPTAVRVSTPAVPSRSAVPTSAAMTENVRALLGVRAVLWVVDTAAMDLCAVQTRRASPRRLDQRGDQPGVHRHRMMKPKYVSPAARQSAQSVPSSVNSTQHAAPNVAVIAESVYPRRRLNRRENRQ